MPLLNLTISIHHKTSQDNQRHVLNKLRDTQRNTEHKQRKPIHTTRNWPPPPPAWGVWGVWGQRRSVWSPTHCQRASSLADTHSPAPGSYCRWSEGVDNRMHVSLPACTDMLESLLCIIEKKTNICVVKIYGEIFLCCTSTLSVTSKQHCGCMCVSPGAINACTAEQSFGSRSECESHRTDRRAAREDTMTMKPQLDTFLNPDSSLYSETGTHTGRDTHRKRPRKTKCVQVLLI